VVVLGVPPQDQRHPVAVGARIGRHLMRPLDPRLLHHARATRPFLLVLVGLGVATAALVITQAWLLSGVLAPVFLDGADLAATGPALVALAAVLAGRAVLVWLGEPAAYRAAATVRGQLRERLLTHVLRLGPRWLAGQHSGELSTLATRGLDALDPYFARYLPALALAAVVPAAVGTTVLIADWTSAVIIAVTLPLIPLFMVLVGLHTRDRTDRQWRGLTRLAHHFLDVVTGLPTLRAYGRAAAQRDTIARVGEEHRRATMGALRLSFLSSLVLELLATLSVALVAVSVGLRLVGGGLDLRTALLVLILAPEAYLPLRAVGAQYHAAAEGVSAAERVFAVLETTPAMPGGTALPPARPSTIRLRGVGVDGRDGPVLDGFDLELGGGTVTGLVGPSGCGKSTVLAVLLGFCRPDRGTVTVDGTPLDELDLDAWRATVAWVPQRPRVFGPTVGDAVRLGTPAATDAEVATAARAAGLDLAPATPVGEGGTGLSTGQRRRVALARALLTRRPVVLLDEPTEGVDAGAERAIVESLRTALLGRTVLVVTHRPEVLRCCDRVVELAPAAGAV
jgi:ATP-binding cassette, subfamily C, bacterial CydCD